jgi:hypothetical protein
VKKGNGLDQSGYDSVASFQTPIKGKNSEMNFGRESKESTKFDLQENQSLRQENAKSRTNMQPYTDKSINDTINLLRKNLQGINIHLGN